MIEYKVTKEDKVKSVNEYFFYVSKTRLIVMIFLLILGAYALIMGVPRLDEEAMRLGTICSSVGIIFAVVHVYQYIQIRRIFLSKFLATNKEGVEYKTLDEEWGIYVFTNLTTGEINKVDSVEIVKIVKRKSILIGFLTGGRILLLPNKQPIRELFQQWIIK